MKFTSDKATVLTSDCGVHTKVFPAGAVMDVPALLVPAAQAHPDLVQVGNTKVVNEECMDKVQLVAEAMNDIMEKDDPELLEASGIPRTSEIKKLVGGKLTKKVLEEAWAIVEG